MSTQTTAQKCQQPGNCIFLTLTYIISSPATEEAQHIEQDSTQVSNGQYKYLGFRRVI
jgi:hypothetical protein